MKPAKDKGISYQHIHIVPHTDDLLTMRMISNEISVM